MGTVKTKKKDGNYNSTEGTRGLKGQTMVTDGHTPTDFREHKDRFYDSRLQLPGSELGTGAGGIVVAAGATAEGAAWRPRSSVVERCWFADSEAAVELQGRGDGTPVRPARCATHLRVYKSSSVKSVS